MRRLDSVVMAAAEVARVPAGAALAVDREVFSREVAARLATEPRITVCREEITGVPPPSAPGDAVIIATGPLTSDALSQSIQAFVGEEHLSFYDAISPIVLAESIDMDKVFRQSRWGRSLRRDTAGAGAARTDAAPVASRRGRRPTGPACGVDDGEGDYLNCPFTKAEYERFYDALVTAESATIHDFDTATFFEGCLPIEVMAHRGTRHAALRPDEAGRARGSARRAAPLRRGAAPAGHPRRRPLQPGGLPDAAQVGRTGARAAHDSRAGARRVRALRHGAPQHVHQRAQGAAAHLADQGARRPVLRRPDLGCRRLRGVGGVGSHRRPERRARGPGASTPLAPPRTTAHRRARLLRVARRPGALPAVEHHLRDHAAARRSRRATRRCASRRWPTARSPTWPPGCR